MVSFLALAAIHSLVAQAGLHPASCMVHTFRMACDKFLDTTSQYVNEPGYTEAYSQIDFSVSYDFSEDLTVSLEGINITEENARRHGRTSAMLWRLDELGARYAVGVRYKF